MTRYSKGAHGGRSVVGTRGVVAAPAWVALIVLMALVGCAAVGNDFVAPEGIEAPGAYRHADAAGGQTRDAQAQAGSMPAAWWAIFGDTALDDLERQAEERNSSMKAAASRLLQARAQQSGTRANVLPSLSAGVSAENLRTSGNTPQGMALRGHSVSGNQYTAGLSMSYEIDLWGRLRRVVEASEAQVEAAQADRDAVKLLLSTQLATTYWQWRGAQAEAATAARMLDAFDEAARLVTSRFDSGLAGEQDVARARIDRENAAVELEGLKREIDVYEHAIGTLAGRPASTPLPAAWSGDGALPPPPAISPGLPASLVRQRPDLAASYAQLRAASAQVGVAQAAFYPSIQLTGSYGYASEELRRFLDGNSRQYDFGPLRVTLPIFDGGRNQANLLLAKARYEEAVANHQDKVLGALREVEDALSDGEHRGAQALHLERARQEARRAVEVARTRYERGLVTYLEVLSAQRSELSVERAAIQVHAQRLLSSVALIRAVGGGWTPALERSSPSL
jgi:outer membrane protein, multidrug efflux system